jgi:hypothetical protein
MSTTPAANPAAAISGPIKQITTEIAALVQTVHKEAALVLGFLTASGVTPVPGSEQKITSALLIGYAAVCHFAEQLFNKTP